MFIVNSKLINLLESFADKDLREFRRFVSSNFFTKGRNYISIIDLISKYKNRGYNKITPEKIYSKLYPGKKPNLQTLNNRFSELFKLGEEYLILKTLKENKTEKNRLLLMAYQKNKMNKFFEHRFRKSKDYVNSFAEGDSKFLNISYLDRMYISYSKDQIISENTFNHYFEHSEYMAGMFLKDLFVFGIEFIQQEQANRSYDSNLVLDMLHRLKIDEAFIKKLNLRNPKIFKVVIMQFHLYNVFKTPENEMSYFEARKIFNDLRNNLEEEDKIEIYKLMTSYCIMRQNHGVKKFQLELFKIYSEKLKLGIYLDNKNIFSPTLFRNHVLIGIKLKKMKWTENFIKKYSKELPEENREDEIKLSYSKLFFSNKNYGKSLLYLSGFRGLNYLHYCDSSLLKLCTYYETKKFEEAFFEMDKFRHYLRNHKEIPQIHKEYLNNFLKIYQILIKIKTGVDKKNIYTIRSQMEKTKLISRESWLIDKIQEF